MSLLDPPRCPNCNSEIALKELWEAAPKSRGGSIIVRPVGIACPICGVKLKVLQARVLMGLACAYVFPFAVVVAVVLMTPWDNDRERRLVSIGVLVIAYFGAFKLHQYLTPRLLRVRPIKSGERIEFPLAKPATEPNENRPGIADALTLEPKDDNRPVWVCPKCGEENPGTFDVCWKCQGERPGAPDGNAKSTNQRPEVG
jgi:DNA-directed RNA polymerase subunit RPC12/RpoP